MEHFGVRSPGSVFVSHGFILFLFWVRVLVEKKHLPKMFHVPMRHGKLWTITFQGVCKTLSRKKKKTAAGVVFLMDLYKWTFFLEGSGQIIIFHRLRFPWNKGISLTKPPFGVRSCEVTIIWPEGCHIIPTNHPSTWSSGLLQGSVLSMISLQEKTWKWWSPRRSKSDWIIIVPLCIYIYYINKSIWCVWCI